MFTPSSVSLLQEVYNWTLADMNIHDLDEKKYNLCKKLAEVAHQHVSPHLTLTCTVGQQSWSIHRTEAPASSRG